MGLLDFLSSEKRKASKLERAIRSANNKFKPKDNRQLALSDVIREAKHGNEIAIMGLLARFNVNAEPSTEDEKEKDWVFDALVDIGRNGLKQIKKAIRSAESVSWGHRVLKNVVSAEEYKAELLDVLSEFDTEYERNPDRKMQTVMALADTEGDEVTEALIPFLKDVNETVRFQTVVSLAKQGLESKAREPMLEAMCEDESIRVRNEGVDAFARLGWLTKGYKNKIAAILPDGYKVEKSGKIIKLGNTE